MLFWNDSFMGLTKSYNDLMNDINATANIDDIIKDVNSYQFFTKLIVAIINNAEVVLLDGDLSTDEEKQLLGTESSTVSIPNNKRISNLEELKQAILSSSAKFTLFTSGTTGRPKKIKQPVSNFLRSVKSSDAFAKNVWAFAYSPSHMAGLQVFFQGIANLNGFVYVFGQTRSNIIEEVKKNSITNISATPTFLRGLLPNNFSLPQVKRITMGGEKFDEALAENLQQAFPNAMFRNIYASTESGSLFTAKGNVFSVPENIEQLIRIDDNVLLVHRSLLGEGEFSFEGDWYVTGDVVEIISNDPIQFVFSHRKSELINVGGYKVNPHEIEETLLRYNGVKNAKAIGKKNALLGNIMIAEVEMEKEIFSEASIKQFLAGSLQEYKIPVFIKRVDRINTTHTGKIERQ
jgi:acyl-coenzyme A synthetase/AMP-(fatty) acid ligase